MMEILGRRVRRDGSTKAAEDRKSKNRSLQLTSNFQIKSSRKRLIDIIELLISMKQLRYLVKTHFP